MDEILSATVDSRNGIVLDPSTNSKQPVNMQFSMRYALYWSGWH